MSTLKACWQLRPAACAQALRLYADKYHPATPDSIDSDATPNAVGSWDRVPWRGLVRA